MYVWYQNSTDTSIESPFHASKWFVSQYSMFPAQFGVQLEVNTHGRNDISDFCAEVGELSEIAL